MGPFQECFFKGKQFSKEPYGGDTFHLGDDVKVPQASVVFDAFSWWVENEREIGLIFDSDE